MCWLPSFCFTGGLYSTAEMGGGVCFSWFWGEGVLTLGGGCCLLLFFLVCWVGHGFTCLLLGGWGGGLFPLGEDGQFFFFGGGVLVCFSLGRDLLVCFPFGLMTKDSVLHVNIKNLNEYQLAVGI